MGDDGEKKRDGKKPDSIFKQLKDAVQGCMKGKRDAENVDAVFLLHVPLTELSLHNQVCFSVSLAWQRLHNGLPIFPELEMKAKQVTCEYKVLLSIPPLCFVFDYALI